MGYSAERRLGDRIARELYRDPDYIDDPLLVEYVQGIWLPLLEAARQRGELSAELDATFAKEILLSKERSVNAFALPGAYLGLHLGLVAVVTSRDELASVLAHELSHVTQRHIARMMTRQSQQAPWLLGAMILGLLAASKSGPMAANATIVGGQAVAAQSQLNFSRDMEREADRIGFSVATQAGFAPEGFVSMFDKLQQSARLNDSGNFPYLRSHPLSTERMADMQARIGVGGGLDLPESSPASGPSSRRNVQEFDQTMLAARAQVISHPTVDALRAWAQEVEPEALRRLTPARQLGALYGATLAAIRLHEYANARQLWLRLSARAGDDAPAARLARLLGVELYLAQDNGAQAAALLKGNDGKASSPSRAELLLSAQAALHGAPKTPVVENLQTWVASHARDAQAWQLLSLLYTEQGQTLGALRAQAEVSVAQLDFPAALQRFKAAQEWVRKNGTNSSKSDHIEASIIDTRTREMELLVREQALER